MKPRTTLIVVALFALLGAYVYFFELNKTPAQLNAQLGTPIATPAQYALRLNVDNVASLEVTDLRAPRVVKLTRAGNGWRVNQPIDKPADVGQVDSALGALTNLTASRVLTNVTDLAPFGLVTATLEARIVMSDTQQYALTVGNKSPDGRYYYAVYTGDKSKVFLIDTSSIDSLKGWLDAPPYEPTPTPTFTPSPTPPITETPPATPAVTGTPQS